MEITWQEGRLDVKHSGSHPEVDLHSEVNLLALADKELHPEVDSHPVDSHPEVNVLEYHYSHRVDKYMMPGIGPLMLAQRRTLVQYPAFPLTTF